MLFEMRQHRGECASMYRY